MRWGEGSTLTLTAAHNKTEKSGAVLYHCPIAHSSTLFLRIPVMDTFNSGYGNILYFASNAKVRLKEDVLQLWKSHVHVCWMKKNKILSFADEKLRGGKAKRERMYQRN